MTPKKTILVFLLAGLTGNVFAQDSLDLQQCIEYGIRNNIQIHRANNDLIRASSNQSMARASLLPSINGVASQNYNFGRTIDPSTNQFATQSNRANSFSLNSDLVIFSGLQKLNQNRQANWSKTSGMWSVKKMQDDISLTIANQYLQIMLLTERQRQLKNQAENSRQNLKRTRTLVEAGSQTQARLLEAEAQVATDESSLVEIENQLLQAHMSLKETMHYDIVKPINVKQVKFKDELLQYTENDLYKALDERVSQTPAVQVARSNRESSLYAWKAAKGDIYPRLIVSGSLHSIYSSLGRNYSSAIAGYEPIGILGSDSSQIVFGPRVVPVSQIINFRDQLNNNFGKSLGFTLSVPIFNGFQVRHAVTTARLNMANSELALNEAEIKARNDIYQSFESMKMNRKKLEAAETRLKAQQSLLKQVEASFNAGVTNFYDYNLARTSYSNAQIDVLQARYEFIFQTKIFEYYLGKPVQF